MSASSFSAIIEGTGSNAHIKPAVIQASINAADSSSKILLSADYVEIDGDLIAGSITADDDIICGELTCTGLTVSGEVTLDPDSPVIPTGGSSDYTLGDMIVYAEVDTSTNTLKLWSLADAGSSTPTISFSKAVPGGTISGVWDGSLQFDYSAGGLSGYTNLFSSIPAQYITWNGATGTATLRATMNGGETPVTVGTVTVNGSGAYGNGWNGARNEILLPAAIEATLTNADKTASFTVPRAYGVSGEDTYSYTLSRNSNFRPSGVSSTVPVVELTDGSSNVVARIDCSAFAGSGSSPTVTAALWRSDSTGDTFYTGGIQSNATPDDGYIAAQASANGVVTDTVARYFALRHTTFVVNGDPHSCVELVVSGYVFARIDMSHIAASYGIPTENTSTSSCTLTRYGASVPSITLTMSRKDSSNVGLYYGNTQVANLADSTSNGSSHTHAVVLNCTGKTQTYPGATGYNYTFTLGGASGDFATQGETKTLYY